MRRFAAFLLVLTWFTGTSKASDWSLMETDHFNFYHQLDYEPMIRDILPICVNELERIENKIGYRLSGRLDIYIYPTPYEKAQALSHFDRNDYEDRGGLTIVQPNTVHISLPGSRSALLNELTDQLANHLLIEMLYGGTVQERIKYATLLHLPDWFSIGLSHYLSRGWDSKADNQLRDAFNSEQFKAFNSLPSSEQILAGRSIWHYIEVSEGLTAVQRILHLVRLTRKVETALYYVTGQTSRDIYTKWHGTMSALYAAELKRRLPTHPETLTFAYPHYQVADVDLSADATHLVFSIAGTDHQKVVVFNREKNELKEVYTSELSASLLCRWLDNERIAVIQNSSQCRFIEIDKAGAVFSKHPLELDYVHSFDVESASGNLAISGVRHGSADIYWFENGTDSLHALTFDGADDLFPSIDDLGNIYFSRSHMLDGNTPEYDRMDVWLIVQKDGKRLSFQNVSRTPLETEIMPIKLKSDYVSFLSDRNGIFNAFAFNRKEEIYALSDYQSGIIRQAANKSRTHVVEVILHASAYQVFVSEIDANAGAGAILHPMPTLAMREFLEMNGKKPADTLVVPQLPDSVLATKIYFQSSFPLPDNIDSLELLANHERPRTNFKTIQVPPRHVKLEVSGLYLQLNNSNFLTSVFPAYFEPNDQIINRFGFVGGVRIEDPFKYHEFNFIMRASARFDHVQVKANYSHLKGQFYKYIELATEGQILKREEGYLRRRYRSYYGRLGKPLSQNLVLWVDQRFRFDGMLEMSTGSEFLDPIPQNQSYLAHGFTLELNRIQNRFQWGQTGLQASWTAAMGVGTQGKSGIENRLKLEYGKPILHHFIWLNRLYAASSTGGWRSIYFLGGQQNQFKPDYQYSSLLRDNARYFEPVYGVRNAPLNSRNGNSFAFINSEFFIPIHRWIGRKPVRNNMLRNLWTLIYVDAGSAWYGLSPFDNTNPANRTDILYGPLNITVYNTRNPIVYSFGSGLRTKVFGYDVRYDLSWTLDNNVWRTAISGISLGKAF
ncbi:MAG: hypothetical protein H6608_10145 [Flavobacteriales bacterium]|nr:hypothetical protein [Flavobacteriales bacterium]